MTELPRIPTGLGEIAEHYDALLCDVWGVVHNGRMAFTAAVEALRQFRQSGGVVVMLTNAPRPSSQIPAQFEMLGVPDNCWDDIITSGDATRAMLAQYAPGPAFKLGPPKDDPLYEGLPIRFSPLEEAKLISCTGLDDDKRDTPEDYDDVLRAAVKHRLPMICANPDKVVHYGDRLIYCAGALAEKYAALGGEVFFGGKPHEPIYKLARASIDKKTGQKIEAGRILAIGDGLPTDVAGANGQGLDCLFITGGIHGAQIADGDLAQQAGNILNQHGQKARYAQTRLHW